MIIFGNEERAWTYKEYAEKYNQLRTENKALKGFIDKLCSASIKWQPDTRLAWEIVTVQEIIGSDKELELAYKALESEVKK